MTYTKQQRLEQMKKLPPAVRAMIGSEELSEILARLGKEHKLHIDELGQVGAQVNDTLLGLSQAEDFIRELRKNVVVSKETAHTIARDLNDALFSKVRSAMQNKQEGGEGSHTPADQESNSDFPPRANDLFRSKLTDAVRSEMSRTYMDSGSAPQKTRPYSVDPYREPTT